MISRRARWLSYRPSPTVAYVNAVWLAAVAQAVRLPLDPPTLIPYITYVPLILLSAALGGFGPGMLTTGLCILESVYFGHAAGPQLPVGLGALAFTGLVTSGLFDAVKQAWVANAEATVANVTLRCELETRQRMLESIIHYSPGAIALLKGPEFRFSLINPAYQALLPGEPMVGRTVAEVWPAAASVVIPLLNIVRKAQTVYHAEGLAIPVQPVQGRPVEELYFDVSYVPLPGPGEVDVQILVCATDVTGRKRGEIALREAYSELSAIHANAPVVLLVVDEQLRLKEANQMASRLAGRDVAAMLGLRPGSALPCANALPDSQGCGHGPACGQCPVRRAILDTLTTCVSHEGVEAWLPLGVGELGQERCLVVSTTAMKSDKTTKVLICAQDVTERKRDERELANQHTELKRQAELINLSHDAIITADANRVIRSWNRGAEEIYGWTEQEAIGKALPILLKSKSLTSMAQIDEVLALENHWYGEISHTCRNGERIVVDSRQVLVRDGGETGHRILVINRDVTARRRTEDELKQTVLHLESALAEKTVLLQEIHHRVKNNLAVTASLLGMKAESCGPEAKLALEESQQRVFSIALVHEYLYGYDRLDRINFGDYARQLAEGVYSAYGGERRRIELDFELDLVEVGIERAVPCALVLNELLSNAFKYAFPGDRAGRILVSLRQTEPGWCELGVEDDGVGLTAGTLGEQRRSLGFRIVGILTDQLDGSVEQREGPGTHIVLRFPVAA